MQRVSVVGTTGSGKSTFAERLAHVINAQAIHLDDLMWLPNWQKRDDEEYTALLTRALQEERWVVDGNTRKSRALVWNNADTVIWLNYPFWVNFTRLLLRTLQRIRDKTEIFPGCQESFKTQFFSRDSLLLWFFHTYWRRKKEYRKLFESQQFPHLRVIVIEKPRQAQQWLAALTEEEPGL